MASKQSDAAHLEEKKEQQAKALAQKQAGRASVWPGSCRCLFGWFQGKTRKENDHLKGSLILRNRLFEIPSPRVCEVLQRN